MPTTIVFVIAIVSVILITVFISILIVIMTIITVAIVNMMTLSVCFSLTNLLAHRSARATAEVTCGNNKSKIFAWRQQTQPEEAPEFSRYFYYQYEHTDRYGSHFCNDGEDRHLVVVHILVA